MPAGRPVLMPTVQVRILLKMYSSSFHLLDVMHVVGIKVLADDKLYDEGIVLLDQAQRIDKG